MHHRIRPLHEGSHSFWKVRNVDVHLKCLKFRTFWEVHGNSDQNYESTVGSKKQRLVLMDESNCVCMCSLVVSIFTGNFKLPCKSSHLIHFPLTVNVTTELLFPRDRYSSVENSYTLPQSFSHAPLSINAEGKKKKSRTREDQTQE